MGTYVTLKEKLAIALKEIENLENSEISDGAKKEAYDRYYKQAKIAETQINEYGLGKVFRFSTPKGIFYLVNINKTDIPELMGDLQVESYLYVEINAREIIKL